MMKSAAATLAHDRLDLYIRDDREFGLLFSDHFAIAIWSDEGLASVDLSPHCGVVPVCVQDMPAGEFLLTVVEKPGGMTGVVTLVDGGNDVLDSVEFEFDPGTTAQIWRVVQNQYRRRMSRMEIERRTWEALRCRRFYGIDQHMRLFA